MSFFTCRICAVISLIAFSSACEAQGIDGNVLCRAGIGTLMGRDPKIINSKETSSSQYFLDYSRPDDGTVWTYRCKIEGDKIIWASDTGRWRTDAQDEIISYSNSRNKSELDIVVTFPDGSALHSTYELTDF